ncbi:MAG: HD domain-containing phosphohydrolase, partial [Candidatus Eremiobacterota bacterium]
MNTTRTLDWLSILGDLSLCRTIPQFTGAVEKAARDLGAAEARLYLYDLEDNVLTHERERVTVDAASLAGNCALYCEAVSEGETQAAPVSRFGSLIGVLVTRGGPATLLSELAQLTGLTHEAVQLREDSALVLAATRELLARAVDKLAPGGTGHVTRVARTAVELATLMDLSAQSRQEVWDAAHYHDVGWLALDGRPYDFVRQNHCHSGASFLTSSRSLRHLAPLVLAHHERWDGSGYPGQIARDQVAMEAWVLALAEDLDE